MSRAYGSEPEPLAVAHQGGPALGPENTAEAFDRSYALGFRYLETDVRVTSDGVCVAFHDTSLRRTTGRTGRVADLTWAEVRRLRVGGSGPVPRLDDLLTAWPDARWMIDVKQPGALGHLVTALRGARAAERVCLAGTWDRHLAQARLALGPQLSTAVGWQSAARLLTAGRTPGGRRPTECQGAFVHLPIALVPPGERTRRLVTRAADAGLRLIVWGPTTPEQMNQVLDDGVGGVISDHPDVLREVLVARGQWRAPALRQQDEGSSVVQGAAQPRGCAAS